MPLLPKTSRMLRNWINMVKIQVAFSFLMPVGEPYQLTVPLTFSIKRCNELFPPAQVSKRNESLLTSFDTMPGSGLFLVS